MRRREPHSGPPEGRKGRRGGLLAALPFWIVAALVFVFPFLRPQVDVRWIGEDRRAETDVPFDEDLRLVEQELELELAEPLATVSEAWFGRTSARLRASGLVEVERLAAGERVYDTHCLGCHGENGDGAGPAARFLAPRPRNFRKGIFKFTSTDTGEKPRRDDMLQVVRRGLAGSAMPGFPLLPEEKRRDVVEYVRWLSIRGEFEQLFLDDAYDAEEVPDGDELAEIIVERWEPERLRRIYPDALENDDDQASVERGRELFVSVGVANCSACHGEEGRGDGSAAEEYLDDWGYSIRPRDLTRGVFRAGEHSEDLWRSIATGINGTPMGSFREALTGEQMWDLVHYVQSLARGAREGR